MKPCEIGPLASNPKPKVFFVLKIITNVFDKIQLGIYSASILEFHYELGDGHQLKFVSVHGVGGALVCTMVSKKEFHAF
jgi:hypothetical protein